MNQVFIDSLADQKMPTCRIEHPDFLFERFGYQKGTVCWLLIYEIPRPGLSDATSSTTTRCMGDRHASMAYSDNQRTKEALGHLNSSVRDLQNHIDEQLEDVEETLDANERNDWGIFGLALLNIALTAMAFVVRHLYLRAEERRKEHRRLLARQRLNDGKSPASREFSPFLIISPSVRDKTD